MRAPLLSLALAALSVGALTACGKMAIDGEVVDAAGNPVVGARVGAVGSLCEAQTDDAGKFAFECTPGPYDLSITMPGYVGEAVPTVQATERKRYDVGRRLLVKVPEQEGLLVFDGQDYRALTPGRLERRAGGVGAKAFKHYCLSDKESPANPFGAGPQPFFDNRTDGKWRVYRLDEDGCAYRMSPKSDTQWGIDYAERLTPTTKTVEQGRDIVVMDLQPGRYFVADWEAGFFVKLPGAGEGYSGYLLEVSG